MKRGHITVFLTVLLVAAIAVFAIFTGPSITGLSGNEITGNLVIYNKQYVTNKPLFSGEFCGKSCISDSQCGPSCGVCSPSLGRCVEGKRATLEAAYSWQNYERCRKTCRERKGRCIAPLRASDETGFQACEVNLGRCYHSCTDYHTPENQPDTCFASDCTSAQDIFTAHGASSAQCSSAISPCKNRCAKTCTQADAQKQCTRACTRSCVEKTKPACTAYLPP
jgi:hypothetical protein